MPDVITANRLADGVVVFLSPDAGWTEDFNLAEVLPDAEATKAATARALEAVSRNEVVDVYAFPVETRNGVVVPKALREAIRASGPTVRRDLGKQTVGLAPRVRPAALGDA